MSLMRYKEIEEKALEISKKYNPEGLAPFPYKNIIEENDDLNLIFSDELDEEVSGVITYTEDDDSFVILINKTKPETRRNFTIAHELGHYFLHQNTIKTEEVLVTAPEVLENTTLYRLDAAEYSKIETEANRFAAVLIMPEGLVLEAWKNFENVEECAKIFKVSVSAMSIRLEKLGLLE